MIGQYILSVSNWMGNDPFVDAAESASFPLPGTGKWEGGEKTQPLHHFLSHLGSGIMIETVFEVMEVAHHKAKFDLLWSF